MLVGSVRSTHVFRASQPIPQVRPISVARPETEAARRRGSDAVGRNLLDDRAEKARTEGNRRKSFLHPVHPSAGERRYAALGKNEPKFTHCCWERRRRPLLFFSELLPSDQGPLTKSIVSCATFTRPFRCVFGRQLRREYERPTIGNCR